MKKSNGGMNQQKGIALIYVMLIFAMITLMSSQMVTSLWLHTEKNGRYLERIQARHHALSAEQYVAMLLEQDFEDDKKKMRQVDHGRERWNVETVGFGIEQGEVELKIIDENGRFNLNWLDTEALDGKRYTRQFEIILQNLGIDTQLAFAIKDWIDSDQDPSETGAEDNHYLVLDPPRRTADSPLVSLSELRLIQGIGKDEFELLVPLVTVLPKESKVNVNTAVPEVLRSLSDKITEGDAQAIIDSRREEGFVRLEDMTKLPALKDKTAELKAAGFEFTSSYFNVYIKATYRDTVFYMRTLLVRNADGQVQVAGREIGPADYWVTAKKES